MSHFPLRRFTFGLLLAATLLSVTSRLSADLVWTAATGWKVQGGVLSGLFGKEATSALNLMNRARLSEEKGSLNHAASLYEKVAKKYPSSIYASEALYRAAKLRFTKRKLFKSFEDYQQVISKYPNSGNFDAIIGYEYEISARLLNGERGRILWFIPGFTHREKGVEMSEAIVFNAPYSEYAPLVLLNISRAHQVMGDTEEAIDALDRLINSYPKSAVTPDAYLRVGQLHASLIDGPFYDQSSAKEAITYFEDFMILYPNDPNVSDAEKNLVAVKRELAESKIKIADFYFHKRDNFKGAKVFYNEAITIFPDSDVAAKAKKKLDEVTVAEAKAEAKAKEEAAKNKGKKKKRFFFF